MSKIQIILSGTGGVLDRKDLDLNDGDGVEVSEAIHDAIEEWILSPGDIITIEAAS